MQFSVEPVDRIFELRANRVTLRTVSIMIMISIHVYSIPIGAVADFLNVNIARRVSTRARSPKTKDDDSASNLIKSPQFDSICWLIIVNYLPCTHTANDPMLF